MKFLLNASILLLLVAVVMAIVGAFMVSGKKITFKSGPRFARIAATLVMVVGVWFVQNSKILMGMELWNLVALLGLIWVLGYIIVWGVLVFQFNRLGHSAEYAHSSILSMLYIDPHQEAMKLKAAQEAAKEGGKDAGKGAGKEAGKGQQASNKKPWSD
jgi:ABC-type nickel/cobalt efflux system permease component RcnA